MFNKDIIETKIGRPKKKKGFNLDSIFGNNDSFSKTVVVHVRVSEDEKKYLGARAKANCDSISSYIRRLIFDVYLEKLRGKQDINTIINTNDGYIFRDYRTEYIHIRFTEREKYEVEKLAQQYHRGISDFIRWVGINLPVEELIQNY